MVCEDFETGNVVLTDGVMPGISLDGPYCGIGPDTTRILFAAANLDARQADPMMTVPALHRLCDLIQRMACGKIADGTLDILNYVPQPVALSLEGFCDDDKALLSLLGIRLQGDEGILPSWRKDLHSPADIAREIEKLRNALKIQ
jgi:phenylalanyl-tRNA synthetase beta subunit